MAADGSSVWCRRALYSDATSNAVEQTFAAPLTRQDSFYSFLNPTGQGSSAHTDAPQDPSHYTAEDRWGASGMDPLSTVAHVLAATGHTSPPDTANLFGHSMNTSHAPTLQTPGPHVTGSTSLFGPPSGAAATAAAIRPGTPDPRNRTPFSAYGLDQGDPQDISMSEPPPHHPFPGQTPHLMAAPGASSEGYDLTIAAAASLDSSLGSGFIPAYFDTQGTGMPDLPAGSGLDMRNGRFLTSNGFFSARSSQRSAISRDSSFEHGRGEQPDMGDACDTDMGMVHDAPCGPPSTHCAPTAIGTHSGPPSALLSAAFGTLAMDDGSGPMDMCTREQPLLKQVPAAHAMPLAGRRLSARTVTSGSDQGQRSSSNSPASHYYAPWTQPAPQGTTHFPQSLDLGDAEMTQQYLSHLQGMSSSPSGDGRAPQQGDAYPVGGQASNQQVGMGFRGAEPTGRPYSPALDVDMLRSMGYVPQDVMDDGGYSLGKVSGARRARTMAEGPKPRQGRLPPSPRSIMDQRFSSGTVSGGSSHHSRTRFSREARSSATAAATAAESSLWSRAASTPAPQDSPQYFLPTNLVSSASSLSSFCIPISLVPMFANLLCPAAVHTGCHPAAEIFCLLGSRIGLFRTLACAMTPALILSRSCAV